MELGVSVSHSQGLYYSADPEPNHSNSFYLHLYLKKKIILSPHLLVGLPGSPFPLGLNKIKKYTNLWLAAPKGAIPVN